jgi:hypothetical protein
VGPRYTLKESIRVNKDIKYVYEPGPFSCRRRTSRRKVQPAGVKCWSHSKSPSDASAIEVDTKGARLIFPWRVRQGETVTVSFCNGMGLYRTEQARIAWTQEIDSSGRTIAGLYYEPRRVQAA